MVYLSLDDSSAQRIPEVATQTVALQSKDLCTWEIRCRSKARKKTKVASSSMTKLGGEKVEAQKETKQVVSHRQASIVAEDPSKPYNRR